MNLSVENAVSHIVTSLQEEGADYWTDEGGITWIVSRAGNDSITIELQNELDEETILTKTYRLVEVDE